MKTSMPQHNLKVFTTPEELAKAAADFVLNIANACVQQHGSFTIALSGGSTPKKLYQILAEAPYNTEMPWQQTHVFWGDERCVPLNDPNNNAHNAIKTLFSKVEIPELNIRRIQSQLPPAEAAAAYTNELETSWKGNFPEFDLILLGMGEDGHTASLFPGTDILSDQVSLVKEVYVPQQHMHRITMMPRLINRAHNIVFLVAGTNKSIVLADVLSLKNSSPLPAKLIQPVSGKLCWFVDEAAAANL